MKNIFHVLFNVQPVVHKKFKVVNEKRDEKSKRFHATHLTTKTTTMANVQRHRKKDKMSSSYGMLLNVVINNHVGSH